MKAETSFVRISSSFIFTSYIIYNRKKLCNDCNFVVCIVEIITGTFFIY
eukprot:UN20144